MTPIRTHILNALAEEGLAPDQALLLADAFEAELTQMVADGRLRLSGKLAEGAGRDVACTGADPVSPAADQRAQAVPGASAKADTSRAARHARDAA